MSALVLEMSIIVGVGTALRLERGAWTMVEILKASGK